MSTTPVPPLPDPTDPDRSFPGRSDPEMIRKPRRIRILSGNLTRILTSSSRGLSPRELT